MSKKNLMHVANRVLNTPLFVEPGYARVFFNSLSSRIGIQNLYDADGKVEQLEKPRVRAGAWDEDDRATSVHVPYRILDGVAVLPVSGTLVHKHGYLEPYSGMTGYDGIIARLRMALADKKVQGVLFDYDTPGGEVAGCFDATRMIRSLATASGKPVWSLCYDMNTSAGMALACASERRLVTQTGVAGSVGVVMAHANWEAYLEKEGVDVTLIYSGAHKVDGNPYSALPDDVLKDCQSRMDVLRNEFATLVSELTGLNVDAVLGTEARCYRGQEAIEVGFADELVNGNEAVSIFAEYLSGRGRTTITTGDTPMSNNATTTQTSAPAVAAPAASSAVPETTGTAVAAPEASSAEDRKAERARISAITGCDEAKGRESLAAHFAFNTDMTVEDAKAALAAAPESGVSASGSPLDQAMQAAGTHKLGADSSVTAEPSGADSMMANYYQATGRGKGPASATA